MKLVTLIVIFISCNLLANTQSSKDFPERVNLNINRNFEIQLRSFGFIFEFPDAQARQSSIENYIKSLDRLMKRRLRFNQKKELALAYSQYLTSIITMEDTKMKSLNIRIKRLFKTSATMLMTNPILEDEAFEVAANISYLYGLTLDAQDARTIKNKISNLNAQDENQKRLLKSYLATLAATQDIQNTAFVLNKLNQLSFDYKDHYLYFSSNEKALEFALNHSEDITKITFHKVISYTCETRKSEAAQILCASANNELLNNPPTLYQFTYMGALVSSCLGSDKETIANCSMNLKTVLAEKEKASQGYGKLIYANMKNNLDL